MNKGPNFLSLLGLQLYGAHQSLKLLESCAWRVNLLYTL